MTKYYYLWSGCKYGEKQPKKDPITKEDIPPMDCRSGIIESNYETDYYQILEKLEKKYENIKIHGAWECYNCPDEDPCFSLKKEDTIFFDEDALKAMADADKEFSEWELEMEKKIVFAEKGEPTEHRGLIPPSNE